MEFLFLVWVGCAVAGGAITNSKNRGWGVGVAWGGLLGVIGLIVVACMQPASLAPPGVPKGRSTTTFRAKKSSL